MIKNWYTETYETDDLGHELDSAVSFEQLEEVLNSGKDVYNFLGVQDSLVRERVFNELANIQGKSYSQIYELWLEGIQ